MKLACKSNRFKGSLYDVVNKTESLQPKTYRDIYNFWLNKSINSNHSQSNVVNISKHFFFQQYKVIIDENLIENKNLAKMGQRKFYTLEGRYTLTVLHETFTAARI